LPRDPDRAARPTLLRPHALPGTAAQSGSAATLKFAGIFSCSRDCSNASNWTLDSVCQEAGPSQCKSLIEAGTLKPAVDQSRVSCGYKANPETLCIVLMQLTECMQSAEADLLQRCYRVVDEIWKPMHMHDPPVFGASGLHVTPARGLHLRLREHRSPRCIADGRHSGVSREPWRVADGLCSACRFQTEGCLRGDSTAPAWVSWKLLDPPYIGPTLAPSAQT